MVYMCVVWWWWRCRVYICFIMMDGRQHIHMDSHLHQSLGHTLYLKNGSQSGFFCKQLDELWFLIYGLGEVCLRWNATYLKFRNYSQTHPQHQLDEFWFWDDNTDLSIKDSYVLRRCSYTCVDDNEHRGAWSDIVLLAGWTARWWRPCWMEFATIAGCAWRWTLNCWLW